MEKNINSINNICVILTPFQLIQLKVLSTQEQINFNKSICFLAPIISEASVKEALGDQVVCFKIPWKTIRFTDIIKKPWVEIPVYRQFIKNFKNFIIQSLKENIKGQSVNLFLGTEKDIFTQVLMTYIVDKRLNNEIIAIDEGIGFYNQLTIKDHCFKIAYSLFTPFIFGMKIFYTSVLGVHPYFTQVYARFVKYLPYKNNRVKYHTLNSYNSLKIKEVSQNNKILMLTSPLIEGQYCTKVEAIELLEIVFTELTQKGYTIYLKPHPREDIKKYEYFITKYKIKYLSKENSAETLDYFDFNKIIHFGSSIILDLYQRKYPLSNVVTLDIEKGSHQLTQNMYDQGVYINLFSKNMQYQLNKEL